MAVCPYITLSEAARLWWSGNKLDNYCLYGASTLWISRCAKLLGFLGLVTILIDLIGEDRVLSFLDGIGKISVEKRETFEAGIKTRTKSIRVGFDKRSPAGVFFDSIGYILYFISIPYVYIRYGDQIRQFNENHGWADVLVAWSLFAIFSSGIFIGFIVSSPIILAFFLRPFELMTSNRKLCWGVRLISAVLVAVSVSLDILTS